jgi:protein-S-isoprenylcysteine O-methyltransferase Ste14
MREILRWYFVTFYGIGLVVVVVAFVSHLFSGKTIDRPPIGVWIYAAAVVGPLGWLLPPALLLLRVGELRAQQPPVELVGLGISLYATVFLVWAFTSLGRFFVPYVATFKDHALVTTGPFRYSRHPIYSAGLALFLGAGLGTLNGYLIGFWPIVVVAFWIYARLEERLLREKFGTAYETYAQETGFLVPRFLRLSTRTPRPPTAAV